MLFQHPELYRTGVAVSPVTHWALYDNVYTERFNGLITDNREGYDRGSPHQLRRTASRATCCWSTASGDDNVHFQNSEMLINALVAAGQAVRDDGVPQPDPLHLPGEGHPRCICSS